MEHRFHIAFIKLSIDERITVWHISIYMAIFFRWEANAFKNPVSITRREIMKLAHVGSIATYHKCMKQLSEFGYLKYMPSYNPSIGSRVHVE